MLDSFVFGDFNHNNSSQNIILASQGASGVSSPSLIFQRGTFTDNDNDWRIQDVGGYLTFYERGNGSTDWNSRCQMTTGGFVSSGTISATGNISGGSFSTAGTISATGNIAGGSFSTTNTVISGGLATLYKLSVGPISGSGINTINNAYGATIGRYNTINNYDTLAVGQYNTISGQYGVAMGYYNQTKGQYSVAMGCYNQAIGQGSFALGKNSADAPGKAIGASSVSIHGYAFGTNSFTNATFSSSSPTTTTIILTGPINDGTTNSDKTYTYSGEINFGIGDLIKTETEHRRITAINTNTSAIQLSSAFSNILNNESLTVVIAATATGQFSQAIGINARALYNYATAIGLKTVARGEYGIAIGNEATAQNTYSTSIGNHTAAEGTYTLAFGNYASATNSYAVAIGNQVIANGNGDPQFVIGKYNAADTTSPFIIGWGTSSTNRKNIFSVSNTSNVTATSFTGNLIGNADTATAANITTTQNSIACYTDTNGTFGPSTIIVESSNGVSTKLSIGTNETSGDHSFKVSNSQGSIGLDVEVNRGLWDYTANAWMIVHNKSADRVYIPDWASIGNNQQPIYFDSNGKPVTCTYPAENNSSSCNWFKGIPQIASNGVMEIGKYIDFHATANVNDDYTARITARAADTNAGTDAGLTLTGTTIGTFQGNLTGTTISGTNISGTNISSGDISSTNLTVSNNAIINQIKLGSSSSSTALLYASNQNTVVINAGGISSLVVDSASIRRSSVSTAAAVTCGTSSYPWAATYTKKLILKTDSYGTADPSTLTDPVAGQIYFKIMG